MKKQIELNKNTNELYLPCSIDEFQQLANVITDLKPAGISLSNNHLMNNPNRFKKIFENETEKLWFIKKLSYKFDNLKPLSCEESKNQLDSEIKKIQEEFDKLQFLKNSEQEEINLQIIAINKLQEKINVEYFNYLHNQEQNLTEELISQLNKSLKERNEIERNIQMHQIKMNKIEDELIGFEININQKVFRKNLIIEQENSENLGYNIAIRLKDEILNPDSLLYNVINVKNPCEVIKKPNDKIVKQNPVKVFVIDSFIENNELTCPTFNHPKLDEKIANSAMNKKIEANEHATHVCGIIAKASNTDIVFDLHNKNGNYEKIDLVDAQVVNMSIGAELSFYSGTNFTYLFHKYAGKSIFIKALGNDSTTPYTHYIDSILKYPLLQKHIIFVGNVMSDGKTLAPDSNIPGMNKIIQSMTVVAPGTNIDSYIPIVDEEKFQKLCPSSLFTKEGHAKKTGTSMAAPFVSGLAATLLSKFPNMPLEELVNIIKGGCTKIGESHLFGCGLIDFESSISAATFLFNRDEEAEQIIGNFETLALEID